MVIEARFATGLDLMRHLPDLGYFAKDRQGRFIAANAGFLEMAGCKAETQLLGKTDFDLWPAFLAEQYVKDDARVIASAAPLLNKVELVLRQDRSADWFTTTKVPMMGPQGEVAGIEGVCRYLRRGDAPGEGAPGLSAVIHHIMENYRGRIEIPVLASLASLSVKQFERRFKQAYGSVPVQYIQRIRLDAARQLLARTRLSITHISRETGFYDSSHFSRLFQRYTGLTPKEFRQAHAPGKQGSQPNASESSAR